ncbi:MAG: hypothetical protein V4760_12725 [Bdellovibrionota bacterium]
MTLLRTAIAVPAFIVGVLTFQRIGAESEAQMIPIPNVTIESSAGGQAKSALTAKSGSSSRIPQKKVSSDVETVDSGATHAAADLIVERRLRIEGLLTNLDHVAAVALQMKPEESDRLEPIIVDLAERTLELVDAEQLSDPSADLELDDLEETLKGLMQALTRQVATETTL